jgi:hypothetical protein
VGPDYCYSCDRYEPIPADGYYLICLECGHVFVDRLDLEDSALSWQGILRQAEDLKFCPLCLHDF